MNGNEKYAALLLEIGELIHEKNYQITSLNFRVERLTAELETANEKIKELKGKNNE